MFFSRAPMNDLVRHVRRAAGPTRLPRLRSLGLLQELWHVPFSTISAIRSQLLLAAGLMLFAGCSDGDETVTPSPPEDPRKTIAGVMQELIAAYEARDLARYEALFDQEHFLFVFDPYDVSNPDTQIPPNWDWVGERTAHLNMFQDQFVQRIEVDFVVGTPEPAAKQDVGERAFPEGTMKVILSEVNLNIEVSDPGGSESLHYIVEDGQATFFLYPDHDEVIDDVPAWKIFEWRDRFNHPTPTQDASWGQVKALYR